MSFGFTSVHTHLQSDVSSCIQIVSSAVRFAAGSAAMHNVCVSPFCEQLIILIARLLAEAFSVSLGGVARGSEVMSRLLPWK